ncbi:Crp/Fnr family transcriptional regulator [Streptomyces sp. NPDC018057]|uniref:Crp/Fnr family transcriptional regulator n=1 Tax=unclassified Streptomyces TaxID=2593676 RepID=UPI00379C0D26
MAERATARMRRCSAVRMTHGSNADDRTPSCRNLPDAVLEDLERLGTRCQFAEGDVLIREGDHAQDLVVLREGLVKVSGRLNGGDQARLMDIRIARDVLGELSTMTLKPRSATVVACGDVTAAVIPWSELQPFLIEYPEAALALYRLSCERLRRSDRWRLEFGGYPVKVRLARVLVELAESYGEWGPRSVRIDVNLTQSEFAALTGCGTRAVQQAFAHLRDAGVISTGSWRIFVCKPDQLREEAQLPSRRLPGVMSRNPH